MTYAKLINESEEFVLFTRRFSERDIRNIARDLRIKLTMQEVASFMHELCDHANNGGDLSESVIAILLQDRNAKPDMSYYVYQYSITKGSKEAEMHITNGINDYWLVRCKVFGDVTQWQEFESKQEARDYIDEFIGV